MARAASPTRPIQALYEAIQSLEAAALVCLATPKKRPVHRLRTFTRRIEAQLHLIALLPDTPRHAKQRTKTLALLRKLRRAAGAVRDLDVERDLIAHDAARIRGRSHRAVALRDEAATLDDALKHRRTAEAEKLVRLLRKERKKLPLAFESLREALAPAKKAVLTEDQLIALTRDWFARGNPPQSPAANDDAGTLHDIRKRAKLARYMAESPPRSGQPAARARRLAAHFEALQEAGGHWHDWLQLAGFARKQLGKSAQLPERFSTHANSALRTYKHKLASHLAPST
ncbi:MAG TPA: CHAD domain-containing protein [Acidobacteriaceae bacterium]|nr:CHAD domain-containing protein [Acidobacteriaceae bacterium]